MYKYIGKEEQLLDYGYKKWRTIFMVKKLFDDMYVHITVGMSGFIQRGNHIEKQYIGKDDWLCDSIGSKVQQQDIQDLIDDGLIEVLEDV